MWPLVVLLLSRRRPQGGQWIQGHGEAIISDLELGICSRHDTDLRCTRADSQRGVAALSMAKAPEPGPKGAKGPKKAKEGSIEMDGTVLESLPNAMFRVELDANQLVSLY